MSSVWPYWKSVSVSRRVSISLSCCESIANKGLPILCLDTCSILDTMRDPTRKELRVHEHQSSLALLEEAEANNSLCVLIADQVYEEFLFHVDEIQKEAERALNKFMLQMERVDSLVNVHGSSGGVNSSHWRDHVQRSRDLAKRWIDVGFRIERSNDIMSRAALRSSRAITPAQRGKDSIKDCIVLETYFDYVRCLREIGLTSVAVFCSSNTRDYTDVGSSEIRQDIGSEFDGLGLRYAPNMGAAKHLLGL